jgi:hypothetical protein
LELSRGNPSYRNPRRSFQGRARSKLGVPERHGRDSVPGGVVTLAGLAGDPDSIDGTGAAANFLGLDGIAIDLAGNAYAVDSGNDTIRKMDPTVW